MSALLDYLQKKKEDRGVMADLRCALVDSKRDRAYPYLGYFNGIGNDHSQKVKQTIAGLFASHPATSVTGNIGSTCLRLCSDDERRDLGKKDSKPGALAKRLQFILSSNEEEIFDRVIRIVLRAKADGVSINYEQLEQDLYDWGNPYKTESVKIRWAQSFWASNVEVSDDIPDQD